MLELVELAGRDLRAARARGVRGNERALARDCLARSYDVVELVDAGEESIRKFERSGLHCVRGGVLQEWMSPAGGGSIPCPASMEHAGDWALLAHGRAFDGLASASIGIVPRASFWRIGDRTLLRRDADGGTLEVTALPIPAEGADEAAAAIRAVAGAGGRVRVPLAQVALTSALASSGFTPGEARERWFLMPLLTRSVIAATTHEFKVALADIEAYGASSGDMNPLHFDDGFARSCGFEGRIAHGMIFQGWLTRFLGNEYPGAGTIYLASRTAFLAPVYPETAYTVRISTPVADLAKGSYSILAQLRTEEAEVVALSYNDVLNRGTAQLG